MSDATPIPQPRRRSLAELDARIIRAEAVRVQRRAAVQARPAQGAMLALHAAEERLALLRR